MVWRGTLNITAMAGNTYLVSSSDESLNLTHSGDHLILNDFSSGKGRISYPDSDWRVRITSEEERIRLIQVDESRLFGMSFSTRKAVLEAIDPQAHGNPAPEVLLDQGEVNALLFTRTTTPAPEISPLATSKTGAYLASEAIRLSPPSGPTLDRDWFWIEWFGYFRLYGLSYGYHSEFGTFYFGAEGFSEASQGIWIYFNEQNSWLLFSANYGYGKAYSPTLDAVIEIGEGTSDPQPTGLAPAVLTTGTVQGSVTSADDPDDLGPFSIPFNNGVLADGFYSYTKTGQNTANITYSSEGYTGTISLIFTTATSGTFTEIYSGEYSGTNSGNFTLNFGG